MTISFNNALGIHESALSFRSRRAELIANNLSNADTPNYKARDVAFKDLMDGAQDRAVKMRTTREGHISGKLDSIFGDDMYRVPIQPSVDGNTVDTDVEQAKYMRNALEFQSSFTFLNGRFKGLSKAISGQ